MLFYLDFFKVSSLKNIGDWLFTAFMLADLLTGNSFLITFFLTLANLAHALVTLGLIRF
jgi:hypothetical protein